MSHKAAIGWIDACEHWTDLAETPDFALSMTAGIDNKLHAATIDGCRSSTVVVRRIDPATMREEAAVDSGRPRRPNGMQLIAAHGGGVYLLETTDTTTQLLRVDVAGDHHSARQRLVECSGA